MTARGCRGCLKRAGAYTQSTERGTTKRPLQDGCGPAGQSESGAGDWSANQDAFHPSFVSKFARATGTQYNEARDRKRS